MQYFSTVFLRNCFSQLLQRAFLDFFLMTLLPWHFNTADVYLALSGPQTTVISKLFSSPTLPTNLYWLRIYAYGYLGKLFCLNLFIYKMEIAPFTLCMCLRGTTWIKKHLGARYVVQWWHACLAHAKTWTSFPAQEKKSWSYFMNCE